MSVSLVDPKPYKKGWRSLVPKKRINLEHKELEKKKSLVRQIVSKHLYTTKLSRPDFIIALLLRQQQKLSNGRLWCCYLSTLNERGCIQILMDILPLHEKSMADRACYKKSTNNFMTKNLSLACSVPYNNKDDEDREYGRR